MTHIIIGLILFLLGLWGIVANWYSFVDLVWVLLPMLLILGGIVAIISGINNFSKTSKLARTTAANGGTRGGTQQ
jgi:hypothetical protein